VQKVALYTRVFTDTCIAGCNEIHFELHIVALVRTGRNTNCHADEHNEPPNEQTSAQSLDWEVLKMQVLV